MPKFKMEVRTAAHLTGISNYSYNITRFHRVSGFFKDLRIVFVKRDKSMVMLKYYHVSAFETPITIDNNATQTSLYRSVFWRYDINSVMFLSRTEFGSDRTLHRREKVQRFQILIARNFPADRQD
jgi:hypothetical protein